MFQKVKISSITGLLINLVFVIVFIIMDGWSEFVLIPLLILVGLGIISVGVSLLDGKFLHDAILSILFYGWMTVVAKGTTCINDCSIINIWGNVFVALSLLLIATYLYDLIQLVSNKKILSK